MPRAPSPPPAPPTASSEGSAGSANSDSSGVLVEPFRVVEVNVQRTPPLSPPPSTGAIAAPAALSSHSWPSSVSSMPLQNVDESESEQPVAAIEDGAARSQEEVLRKHKLWEGWGLYYDTIPLGPSKSLDMPKRSEEDPDIVGFAYPLPLVAFRFRNERRYPPPKEHEMLREVFMCVAAIDSKCYRYNCVLHAIYNLVNSNKRDSPGYQKCLLKVGLTKRLFRIWNDPSESTTDEIRDDTEQLSHRYWVMALLGRMMGTNTESRVRLIRDGAVEYIFEGARDADPQVQECAICALKGLIQHPEGRQVVTYGTLMECLGKAGTAAGGT